MLKTTVVQIAVDKASFSFDRAYTYAVPPHLAEKAKVGCRVLVPFGGGNRTRQGLILSLDTPAELPARIKPIDAVLDAEPLLSDELLGLAHWMKERTFSTVFECARAMLPTGMYMRIKTVFRAANDVPPDTLEQLSFAEKQIFTFVSRCPDGANADTLLKKCGVAETAPEIHALLKKELLFRADGAIRHTGDAAVRMVRLTADGEAWQETGAEKLTARQKSVLTLLQDVGCASVKEVCYFTSVTKAVLDALVKKNLAFYYETEVLRTPYEQDDVLPELVSTPLNTEQQAALDTLQGLYRKPAPAAALLYGVTGSGKTQVYMNLIDAVLRDGKQVIVLVPEISLTPQMMELFLKRYGRRVAVLHSGLSIGERMDEWKRIRRGDATVVVGTRSAVFAPCDNIGLIVMDEEQEHTYKSENSPRYHARDIAKYRTAQHNALLLLTSATPSTESYVAAISGRYTLCTLKNRFGDTALPQVEVVDLRGEEIGADSIGPTLQTAMQETLDAGKQVILLLNRRGFHTHISCRSCGYVFTCPSCSISMTYHRANRKLNCHYCGHIEEPPAVCPNCQSDKIRYSGLGTQRVEEELAEKFPDVPVLRMDADTTMSRLSYEKNFKAFADGKYKIMIGTQMVAKGLDFPAVGLVGVLSADQSLYTADYRAFETTFSLLTQVVGRAGRRDAVGRAVIQTYVPENYVITLAAKQDYTAFMETEVAARKMMKYPPYADLCLFGFVGIMEKQVADAANRFMGMLREKVTTSYADVPLIALDPTPAAVVRVSGKYRYKLIVKTKNTARMRTLVGELLADFAKAPENKNVTVYADINPVSLL
ncbi:MAG: primosomal protein N' [Clostridia bacterium]|nr:primosomal protein N' [Clostridia bacterium]